MSDMSARKAAVVGLGIGMAHVAGYLQSRHADLVAVADAWEPRRRRIGGTFAQGSMLVLRPLFDPALLERSWEDINVRVYDDVSQVATDPDVDLVSLCTPDDTHERVAIDLMLAGKDLILEKPLALSEDSARRIIDTAESTGRRVAMGYEMRINPAIERTYRISRSGAIGEIRAFSLQHYRDAFRRDKWQNWIQDKKRSGGLIVEETCHWFDVARYITGKEIASVHCVSDGGTHADFDFEDIAFVQGTFADGTILQIGHSLTGFDFSIVIQVHGTLGTIWCGMKAGRESLLDARQTSYVAIVATGPTDPGHGPPPSAETFGEETLEGENIRDHVVECAGAFLSGEPFRSDMDDGLQSLRAALAARRSSETGKVEVL